MRNNGNETFFYWEEKNIFPYIASVIDRISPYMCGEWSFKGGAINGQPANKSRRADLYCYYKELGFLIELKRYWNIIQLRGLLHQIRDLELLHNGYIPNDNTVILGILTMAGGGGREAGVLANYDEAYRTIINSARDIQTEINIQDLNIAVAFEEFRDAIDSSDNRITWGAIFYFASTTQV